MAATSLYVENGSNPSAIWLDTNASSYDVLAYGLNSQWSLYAYNGSTWELEISNVWYPQGQDHTEWLSANFTPPSVLGSFAEAGHYFALKAADGTYMRDSHDARGSLQTQAVTINYYVAVVDDGEGGYYNDMYISVNGANKIVVNPTFGAGAPAAGFMTLNKGFWG